MVKAKEPVRTAEGTGSIFKRVIVSPGIILVVAVYVSTLISGCTGGGADKEFDATVSPKDGSFLMELDTSLTIESVSFYDYDSSEIPVNIEENQGEKIKAIALRKRDGVKEFDIPRTLATEGIDTSTLPEVPQEIIVRVSDKTGKGEIQLYILTDDAYPTMLSTSSAGTESNLLKFKCRVGLKGIQGFIAIEDDGIHLTAGDAVNVSIGEGPIAILMAVRKKGKKIEGRSQPVVVKRKGIVHPGDAWYDEYKSAYSSRPFLADKFETSRIAFVTRLSDNSEKVIISTFDFKYHYDVSALFPEGPVSIDHWGKTEDDFDVLYVRGEFGSNELHKVKVGQANVMRVTGSHDEIIEQFIPEEAEESGEAVQIDEPGEEESSE